jgi:hypothetical protein
MTPTNNSIAEESRKSRQFNLRTLFLFILFCAAILGIYRVPREAVGRWLFGYTNLSKTKFTQQDLTRLEDVIGVKLPPSAIVDLATISGHRDHELTVRVQVPLEESKEFRQTLQRLATPTSMDFLGELQSAAPEWRGAVLRVDSAFQVGDAKQYIFCKPENGRVTVYFEAYDWLDFNFGEAWLVFSP